MWYTSQRGFFTAFKVPNHYVGVRKPGVVDVYFSECWLPMAMVVKLQEEWYQMEV